MTHYARNSGHLPTPAECPTIQVELAIIPVASLLSSVRQVVSMRAV